MSYYLNPNIWEISDGNHNVVFEVGNMGFSSTHYSVSTVFSAQYDKFWETTERHNHSNISNPVQPTC